MVWHKRTTKHDGEISPEEILIDARNLPAHETGALEGKLSRPVRIGLFGPLTFLLVMTGAVLFGRLLQLMVINGTFYVRLSEQNRLDHVTVPAERGIIYDRGGRELAWNKPRTIDGRDEGYDARAYATTTGMGHVLGYVRMPVRDVRGSLPHGGIEGVAGVELAFDTLLRGEPGVSILETDAGMHVVSQSVYAPPVPGSSIRLSLDTTLTALLGEALRDTIETIGFMGGAGALMDVHTGEIIALSSYPEYDPHVLLSGDPEGIGRYATDPHTPYLNRALSGQYTPGSIVKPFIAAAALNEGVVNEDTTIVSTGELRVENPYVPGSYTVFRDWRAHGPVAVRRALAVSSDVYFYEVGGGYGDQQGLGITRIGDYLKRFGFGVPTGIALAGEAYGVVPSPEWKANTFPDDPTWRLGNTYHTAIGQYGFQATPLQAVRATAAIANGGLLLTPRVETEHTPYGARSLDIPYAVLEIVRDGMRDAVLEGTAAQLNVPYVAIAAKTGTAEVGVHKEFVHAWVIGFFPADAPRYAFALLLEEGPTGSPRGAPYVMRAFFDRAHELVPEYFEVK